MTVVIDEMVIEPQVSEPRQQGQPQRVERAPSPSEATAPDTAQETERQLGHIARRLARVRAH
jgi:hypothetical protein